jgi:hypothetical protein
MPSPNGDHVKVSSLTVSVILSGSDHREHESQNTGRVNESRILCVSEAPMGLSVQGLHMTAAGLAVWYTASRSTVGGIYRLYDTISGACLAEQVVPSDTTVIPGGCLGLMDAFLSPSCLWVFLGNLSRDVLVNKVIFYSSWCYS